jgi:hypothetical protein
MDKTANVVLDIEGLPQPPDKCCSGSPKMIVCPFTQKFEQPIVLSQNYWLSEFLKPTFSLPAEGLITQGFK